MRKYIFFLVILLSSFMMAGIKDKVSLEDDDFVIEAYGSFDRIRWNGGMTDDAGFPSLPVIRRSYVIPYNTVVSEIVTIVDKKTKLDGSYHIALVPPSFPLDGSQNNLDTDSIIYNPSGLYPGKQIEIIPDYLIRTNEKLKLHFKRLADWKMKKEYLL